MKKLYKKLTPEPVRNKIRTIRASLSFEKNLLFSSFLDYLHYRKYACVTINKSKTAENLASMMVMEAHKIEKAFSLPAPRPGFGVAVIKGLIKMLKQYEELGSDCEGLAYKKAKSVLAEYLRFHEQIEYDLGSLKEEIIPWADMHCDVAGYHETSKADWLKKAIGNFESCALSRASVRTYDSAPISEETIKDAIRIARKTPSVCNRQAWHTYIVKSPEIKEKLIELQCGCRGFGDTSDFMAVITTDSRSFVGPYERNQAYVDGGLYAMSFLYALHYKGVGACPLHWMVPPAHSKKLRALLKMGNFENIIMVISAGSIPDRLRTAKSVRHEVGDLVTFL